MALHILGTGLNLKQHLTPETLFVLKKCRVIFTLLPDKGLVSYISSKNPASKIVDCFDFYKGEIDRPAIYSKIAAQVIEEGKKSKFTEVAFLSYGHPLFLVSATEKMVMKANSEGIQTKIYPAISSLDTIICDLQLEIGYCFSVYDATLIVNQKMKLNTEIPNFIFQIANINDSSLQEGNISYRKLQPLSDYLSEIYGSEHEIILVVSSQDIFTPSEINKIKIAELPLCKFPVLKSRPTIYIPPSN